MIGPSGGTGIPDLHSALWVLTLCLLGVVGLIVLVRVVRGRRPLLGRPVRWLGVAAAVMFAGYLVDTTDRRTIQGDFDEVAATLEIEDLPSFQGGFIREDRFACLSSERLQPMLEVSELIDRPEGVVGSSGFADEMFELFEVFALRAEAGGWEVSRFVDEGRSLRMYGQRGETVFFVGAFTRNQISLRVTRDECLQSNLIGILENPEPPDDWIEVEEFLP